MIGVKSEFVDWEEHVVSQEKGSRVVHYYLKISSGNSVLAVVGTERSIRHMVYVASHEFLRAYWRKASIHTRTKWRARREVVDWLNRLVSKHRPPSTAADSQIDESKPKSKRHKLNKEGAVEFTQETARTGPTNRNLKIKWSSKGATGIKLVTPEHQLQNLSFQVDEKIELLCQDSGIRGCWFRCKVLQQSQKHLKVQYKDVEDVEGSGNIEEWVPQSKVAAPDKLDMRCPDRLTVRPWPPEDSSDCSLDVGAPVDAWWSNGWWEGVVVGTKTCGSDNLQVYLSGEDRFLTCPRKNLRASRDWVNNKWEQIKAKPDILAIISSNEAPSMLNFKTCKS